MYEQFSFQTLGAVLFRVLFSLQFTIERNVSLVTDLYALEKYTHAELMFVKYNTGVSYQNY
jgi:hypothetical protein